MAEGMILHNAARASSLMRLEIAPIAGDGNVVALVGRVGISPDALRSYAQKHLPGLDRTCLTVMDGQNVLLAHTEQPPNAILGALASAGEALKAQEVAREPWHKRHDMMKLRGWLGNLGQVLILVSSFIGPRNKYDASKGVLNHLWNDGKAFSTVTSVAGNFVNTSFGVQRKTDSKRLAVVKQRVNTLVQGSAAQAAVSAAAESGKDMPLPMLRLPDPGHPILPRRPGDGFMQENATRVSELLKLAGRLSFAKYGNENDNDGLRASGLVSSAAKLLTLTGLDEDPYDLEGPDSLLTKLRRRSNVTSSVMEWVANLSLAQGAFYHRDPDKLNRKDFTVFGKEFSIKRSNLFLFDFSHTKLRPKADWWMFSAAVAFGLSLVAKALAPFTLKEVDMNEFHTHCGAALMQLPSGQRLQSAADLTALMVTKRELPEASRQGFAATYAAILSANPQLAGITPRSNPPAEAAAAEVAQPSMQQRYAQRGERLQPQKRSESFALAEAALKEQGMQAGLAPG